MTETSTAATISTPGRLQVRDGRPPLPGCEVKIANDGEILIKGPNIFSGYWKNEGGDGGDDHRRLVPHGRHRRAGQRGLPNDHRPQEGDHHHGGREEHDLGQPRGRDQAAPAASANRWSSATAGPTSSPWSPSTARWQSPTSAENDLSRRSRSHWPATPTSRLSINVPRRPNQRQVRPRRAGQEDRGSSPTTSPRRTGELTPTMKVRRNVVADKYRGEIQQPYGIGGGAVA